MLINLTDAGRAAMVAPGNTGTAAHRVVEIGLGAAPFAFDRGMKTMPSERKRVTTFGGDNVAPDTVHVVIQDDSSDQYSLYAFGLYLDNGVLFGVYVQDTPILEKSPVALLLLAADVVFATIDATKLEFGPATFLNPPATTERKGVVELATQAEVDAGDDNARAITPKTAKRRYAALSGATFDGRVRVVADADERAAQLDVSPKAPGVGKLGKVRLFGTFGDAALPDLSPRLAATLRAGFDAGAWGREYVDVCLNDGTNNDAGSDAKQKRVVRFTSGGRVLIGDRADDGKTALQVRGGVDASEGVTARAIDAGGTGGQFRAVCDGYGAFIRNDGWSVYFLSTPKGAPDGGFNDYRPFSWSLSTGQVIVDGSGAGTVFGGAVTVAHDLEVGRKADEGHLKLGPVDGYFYANQVSTGWWSPTGSTFQYIFADHTFRVDGRIVWHEGNLDPLDKSKGGTVRGDIAFATGKRLVLAEGSPSVPSLTFANDGAPDTGLYHAADGEFGVTCNTSVVVRFSPTLAVFEQPVTGPTPPAADRSSRLATTEWVRSVLSSTTIGQIVFEPRTTVRPGFLKANGVLVNRADYPELWAYAQASGALVSDADWMKDRWGGFSTGDGATTFRLPELRGEFIRCWSDARGGVDASRQIGAFQGDQNHSHAHSAGASEAPDHNHSAWTDVQGWHAHHGWTSSVGDHQHIVPFGQNDRTFTPPWGTNGENNRFGAQTEDWDNKWFLTSPAGSHNHEFNTEGSGNHGHAVGIGGGGRHAHAITVQPDGGDEARPRNVALLALIRAY
ncbi:phage tail protein [Burkholderia pseudomallei]|uniref:phage tail protein n=1 Tax=Burkholderia pseudomallei TaxID=28450 RepID=UPI0008FF4548|nr:phage tail protein [Burkholderia pseudomallei]APD36804.1 phage tail protein [Burkholderia pseudomallei]ARK42040.1 phage tail protein [Burkholderia pseudomallei]ARK88527.1 phage tail protein [Burkholderia pseudomallei]ARL58900.1 phage tail protein [Burkholderia pseudomallei]ARL65316.1 phage tail protein [Burkholderia pseudomallei]